MISSRSKLAVEQETLQEGAEPNPDWRRKSVATRTIDMPSESFDGAAVGADIGLQEV